MPRKGRTAIALVLDKSGSMEVIRDDTIGAVNAFIKDQREVAGEALFWLTMFDTEFTHVHEGEDLAHVPLLDRTTYKPNGATALLDAVATTIDSMGDTFANMQEAQRPEKVVFVIQTDGQENSSREFSTEDVKRRIRHQTEQWNWQFLFLGADQDAWTAASLIGIGYNYTISYTGDQTGVAYSNTSHSVRSFRDGGASTVALTQNDLRTTGKD